MGVTGLETAFPVLYTGLVLKGRISLGRLLEAMSDAPRRIFRLDNPLSESEPADLTVIDLNEKYTIDSGSFLSMGRSTPFDGMEVYGRILMTIKDGEPVWEEKR